MFLEEFNQYKQIVDRHLFDYLPQENLYSKPVLDGMKYSLAAGGKRLRPILLLAAYEFTMLGKLPKGEKVDFSQALPYAMALEYIHTYSLIHDDLPAMDDDDLRRGKPTNHKVFGEAIAILSGDCLLNCAYESMFAAVINACVCDDKASKYGAAAAKMIASAAGYHGMIGGQVADILSEKQNLPKTNQDLAQTTLSFIHKKKTGALIVSALTAGAALGGAKEELIKDFTAYGNHLGLAFQIADDILDICGDEAELGKPIGSDREQGKLTYPVLYGLNASKEKVITAHEKALKSLAPYGKSAEFFIEMIAFLTERKN